MNNFDLFVAFFFFNSNISSVRQLFKQGLKAKLMGVFKVRPIAQD